MKRVIIGILFFVSFVSCKKDTEEKSDWNMVDNSGNSIGTIYNKTEKELLDCTDCGTFNGYTGRLGNIPGFNCMYFKVGEPTFCWTKNNGNFQVKCSEKFANCFYPNATQFDCANFNCGKWLVRYKITYCPSNAIVYSSITTKQYCGDSVVLFNSNAIIDATNNHPPFNQTNGTSNICLVTMQRTNDLNGVNFR